MTEARYLLDEQFFAHGGALVQALFVAFQKLLLFLDLPPQVTVSLSEENRRGGRVSHTTGTTLLSALLRNGFLEG